MTNERFAELWAKVRELSSDSPWVFMSPYYAYRGAAEQVAETLDAKEEEAFWEIALKKIRGYSNYAGD
jgi:hypothetical protein